MSEEKKVRSVEQIQQEYTQLCAKAGHVQYQLHTLESDLEKINLQLRDLNVEAAQSRAAAEEQAKSEEKKDEKQST